jgi:hypothetical protein
VKFFVSSRAADHQIHFHLPFPYHNLQVVIKSFTSHKHQLRPDPR